MKVYVRHAEDTKAAYLADVPFDRIDTIIPTIRSWGGFEPYQSDDLTGQFVYDGDSGPAAYFEVVLESGEG